MLLVCSYQDCLIIRYPLSTITFFTLPRDHRRKIWIKNSGNKNLNNISDTAVRYFCEKHFNPKHIRRQFNRSILYKFAEPYKYTAKGNNLNLTNEECTLGSEDSIIILDNVSEPPTNKTNIEDTINKYIIKPNHEMETQLDLVIKENGKSIPEENEIIEEIINNPQTSNSIEMDQIEKSNEILEEMMNNPENSKSIEMDQIEKSNEILEEMMNIPENSKSIEMDQIEKSNNIFIENTDESNQDLVSSEKEYENKCNGNDDYENDKHFALSLVGNFQRLSPHKKAIAKIKVLQYLTELEFSDKSLNTFFFN